MLSISWSTTEFGLKSTVKKVVKDINKLMLNTVILLNPLD